MSLLACKTQTGTCPVCGKNLKVIKARFLVEAGDKTYCSSACAELDDANLDEVVKLGRAFGSRSPFKAHRRRREERR